MNDSKDVIFRWKSSGRIQDISFYKELLGIDGETIELKWNIVAGYSSLQIPQEIQNVLRQRNIEPERITDRIIFMSMFNDIDWTRKSFRWILYFEFRKVKDYAKRFFQGHWTSLGPGEEKKWYGTLPNTPEGKWDSTATQMVERFKDTGHPAFKSISAFFFESWNSEKEQWQRHHTLQCGCFEHRALVPKHSVNQLSIDGGVSNWCEQFGLTEKEK